MKTQKPEKQILRKMKREIDDFESIYEKPKSKKPKRGRKEIFEVENDKSDYDDVYS